MATAIYTRLSLDKSGTGTAVARQLSECHSKAAALGVSVPPSLVFSDNDTSATSGVARPGFEALLASGATEVIVWAQDRLYRLLSDMLRVQEAGLTVHSVTSASLNLAQPADQLNAGIQALISTYEGQHKAERMRAAFAQMAADGKPRWSYRPFGFEKDTTHRATEAAALRGAYQTILSGGSLARVARDLNDSGNVGSTGAPWNARKVRQMLLAPRNYGASIHQGKVVKEDAWAGIVDRDTWEAVRLTLTNPQRRTTVAASTRKHLLSNLAECSLCGAQMRIGHNNGRTVYRCSEANHLARTAGPVEDHIRDRSIEILRMPGAESVSGASAPDASVERERGELAHRLNDLGEAFAAGEITRATMRTATASIQTRLADLDARSASAAGVSAFADLWGMVLHEAAAHAERLWDDLDVGQKRTILVSLWSQIDVLGGNQETLKLTPTDLTRSVIAQSGWRVPGIIIGGGAVVWYKADRTPRRKSIHVTVDGDSYVEA